MDISLVIQQIRTYCPALGGRVGGAADFETGIETVIAITDPATGRLAYPSAVVIPLEDDAEPNSLPLGGGLQQIVTETVGVIVEFDATADRRGQSAVSQVEAMKYVLFGALLNWPINPDRTPTGLYYDGGELLTFDRQRLFWMFRFSLAAQISDGDGFQVSGDPLTGATTTMFPASPVMQPDGDEPITGPLAPETNPEIDLAGLPIPIVIIEATE
jgi:hypothetical protein